MAVTDLDRLWKRFDKDQKKIGLYLAVANPPVSIDALIALSGSPAITVLNVVEELKRKKTVCEKSGYEKGFYFPVGTRLEEFVRKTMSKKDTREAIGRLIEYYETSLENTKGKSLVLAELYGQLGDVEQGLRSTKEGADMFLHSANIEKAGMCYDRILDYFDNKEPTEENADIFLESVLTRLSISRQLRPYREQMDLLRKAERIANRHKRWELLARIRIELASDLLVAGETEAAAKSIAEFQSIAPRINNPDTLKVAALTISELHFWQGRILEAIRSYEEIVGDVEEFGSDEAMLKDGPLVGWCYVLCGRIARGMGMISTIRSKAQMLGLPRIEYIADIMKVHALLEVRKISEAEAVLKNSVPPSVPCDIYDHLIAYIALLCDAFIHYAKEDYSGAFACHMKAVDALPALGWVPRHTPWTLEYLAALEKWGFSCETITFKTEIERSINSDDSFMKGAALRYRALRNMEKNDASTETLVDLKNSEKYLSEVGAEIELARTRLALGSYYLNRHDENTARTYLEEAWQFFSNIDRSLFPSDLMVVMPKDKRMEFIIIRIGEMARSLGTIRDRSSFLDTALNVAMDFTMAMRGGFIEVGPESLKLIASRNLDPSLISKKTRKIIGQALTVAAREKKEVVFPISKEVDNTINATIQEGGISSFVGLPVVLGDHLYGYLCLDNPLEDERFSEENLPFIRVLCDQIAVGLSNINMYNEMKEMKDRFAEEASFYKHEMGITTPMEMIVGQSSPMLKIAEEIRHVAVTGSPVLILGETGVGKELVAKAVHAMSDRNDGPFIPVNLATIPQELIASELFGHEKGAFTGATERQKGRFELADGGTIFLDEIGDLPLSVQPKLLRVLQEGRFERLGASIPIQSNFRIISATNKNLRSEVEKGAFRQDLYFRLNVLPLYVPPLRERKEDIPLLAHYFLDKYGKKLDKHIRRILPEEMKKLLNYTWPGNVRELEHAVERAVVLSDGHRISFVGFEYEARDKAPSEDDYTADNLADVERQHIERILKRSNWKISGPYGAASILGLKPSTLVFRMKKLGIKRS